MPHAARFGIASIWQRRWRYGCVPVNADRSLARIDVADILRLAALAAAAGAGLFERHAERCKKIQRPLIAAAMRASVILRCYRGRRWLVLRVLGRQCLGVPSAVLGGGVGEENAAALGRAGQPGSSGGVIAGEY
jgi:hypothetical protein